MSYPRDIQTLVVEDEEKSRKPMEDLLSDLQKEFPMAPPVFATSHKDALEKLQDGSIYHLLILDMGLPEVTDGGVAEGTELGLALLEVAARREAYPMPVVLVISGRLGGVTDLAQINRRLACFAHGQCINKGDMETPAKLRCALSEALKYLDVGIHIKDAKDRQFPGLSPRDEDLLRRCVVAQESCVGVDLEWWSAEVAYPPLPGNEIPWKKVLMGDFLFAKGLGRSSPTFFKIEPADGTDRAAAAAKILAKKLRHVKVHDARLSGSRGLLVTECVCAARPISLAGFLRRDHAEVTKGLPQLMGDLIGQLKSLGGESEHKVAANTLLWKVHKLETIHAALETYGRDKALNGQITSLWQQFRTSDQPVWVRIRQCNHGDLHVENVAIEVMPNGVRAFIFDPGSIAPAPTVRDLAQLEVSLLLFIASKGDGDLVGACRPLFENWVVPPNEFVVHGPSGVISNIVHAVLEMRRAGLSTRCQEAYALAVFDQALIQVGGLHYDQSRNKIRSFDSAIELCALAAAWVRRHVSGVAGEKQAATLVNNVAAALPRPTTTE